MNTTVNINGNELNNKQIFTLRSMLRDLFILYTDLILDGNPHYGKMREVLFKVMRLLDEEFNRIDLEPAEEYQCPIIVNGFMLSRIQASYISEAIQHAIEREAANQPLLTEDLRKEINSLGKFINPNFVPFPRYPQLPNLHAENKPGYEYRDMTQSDLSRVHLPKTTDDGWRRETMEMAGPTGRMMRRLPMTQQEAMQPHQFDKALTVRQLKPIVAAWSDTDKLGNECEVWIGNSRGLSSPVIEVWPLNALSDVDGIMEHGDLLLQAKELNLGK